MKFPEKLWTLVSECTSGAIYWGNGGKTVVVDYIKFENEFLGENSIFKTKKIISFIRQMNLYGFRKCSRFMDAHEFKNPNFVQGRKDLLKNMKRKLGYTLDTESLDRKMKKEHSKISNEKENYVPNDARESTKTALVPEASTTTNYPFPPLNDLNSLPNGWWGNAYDPRNLMYPTYSAALQMHRETYASMALKEDQTDATEKKAENLYWGNLNMYRNVVFVPVPAQYGMYPGFYNDNLSVPYFMPQQDEVNNSSASE